MMSRVSQTGEDVRNDQFDAAYDLSSADEGGEVNAMNGSTTGGARERHFV